MARFSTKSIVFKTVTIYIFVTILNVTIFNIMVFVNQTELISDNAILSSQHKGSALKYRIDNIIENDKQLSEVIVNKIVKEAKALGINDLTLFSEGGKVFVDIKSAEATAKQKADINDYKMIHKAIAKRSFEDRLFFHRINKSNKTIDLYIPFTYETEKIGVSFIRLAMKDIDRAMRNLLYQCLFIAVLIIVIHLIFAWLLSKMILIPLRQLNEATQSIAQGELDIRVPIVRDDEIGRLASSFNEMSVALQRMRDEAKGANPLTGLPGNVTIAKYIDDSLAAGRCISVLYCDLDNFKAYNDKYGFTKGDEAILYTRDCLLTVAKRRDMQNIFVGHEGGDDFVVVSAFEYWEPFCKAFVTTFDRGIYQFYNGVDARNGFIESINRRGERQRFPLMSISIAVVSNKMRPFRRHAEMIQVAAEVKKHVKSMDGSCYAIDRRTGSISPTQKYAVGQHQGAQPAPPPQPRQRAAAGPAQQQADPHQQSIPPHR
ncbi:MAG: HAMP domain-containing protein [Chitinivibrionales bacterium]|nr:HAMP domain-containing protein [Chitinivibrionales bacterium]